MLGPRDAGGAACASAEHHRRAGITIFSINSYYSIALLFFCYSFVFEQPLDSPFCGLFGNNGQLTLFFTSTS